MIIQTVIDQHAEEAAFLWLLRDAAVSAPHYTLKDLTELDQRLEAHMDGLRIAGDPGWETCVQALESGESGEFFAAGVLALESQDGRRFAAALGAGSESPEAFRGLVSALGWVAFPPIQGLVGKMLTANSTDYRRLGIAACAIHRQDPGRLLDEAIRDPDAQHQARALRAVGELKRRDLLPTLRELFGAEDETQRFWAAWSASLLGDRSAPGILAGGVRPGAPFAERSLQLAVRALDGPAAREFLKGLSGDRANGRYLFAGMGILGDPWIIPWLIEHMMTPDVARLAGEAFSMITGVDIAYEDLEGEWPEGFEAGPTENPEDEDVAMDPDEDLPWPEPALIRQWWAANQSRFSSGTRYLAGQPITEAHCRHVLGTGFQRQRIAAAYELALMKPEEPLFEFRAPGFRQQALLGVKQAQ